MALVGLEKVVYSVSEDTDVAELCAVVTNPTTNCPIDFPFNVSLLTHDKSAGKTRHIYCQWQICITLSTVNHTDYSAPSVTLKFATCETRQCLNVSIMDDVVDEPEESFSYTLERLVNLDPRIILAPSAGEVFILDNDGMCTPVK